MQKCNCFHPPEGKHWPGCPAEPVLTPENLTGVDFFQLDLESITSHLEQLAEEIAESENFTEEQLKTQLSEAITILDDTSKILDLLKAGRFAEMQLFFNDRDPNVEQSLGTL